jgi:hypothetical protein
MLDHWNYYNSVFDVLSSFIINYNPENGFEELFLILRYNSFSNVSGIICYNSVCHEFEYETIAHCNDTTIQHKSLREVIDDFDKFEGNVIWKSHNTFQYWIETILNFNRIKNNNVFPCFDGKIVNNYFVAFSFFENNASTSCNSYNWYE